MLQHDDLDGAVTALGRPPDTFRETAVRDAARYPEAVNHILRSLGSDDRPTPGALTARPDAHVT